MKEKKDIFNGKIKHQFVSYIRTTIISVAVIFFGGGGWSLYLAFAGSLDRATSLLFLVVGVVSFLFGIWNSFGTIFIIRKYPKYKKITKWFLNSEYYFVDCDSKEFHGHWRGKPMFDAVTDIGDQNEQFEHIKYPKKYYVYIWVTVIGIILTFVDLIVAFLVLSNIEKLPRYLQSEGIVFTFFMLLEVVFIVVGIVFAFRIKKVREITRAEYKKQMEARGVQDQHHPLYTALIDISARKNNKKRKFWYETAQLNEIEDLVYSAHENAELKLERKGDKLISFKVVDVLNEHVVFTGLFIQNNGSKLLGKHNEHPTNFDRAFARKRSNPTFVKSAGIGIPMDSYRFLQKLKIFF